MQVPSEDPPAAGATKLPAAGATPSRAAGTIEPRTGLAAERTLLAWVRTGLSMMGFGFVVARFGLFLRELAKAEHLPPRPSFGLSVWFGSGLLVLGVIVLVLSAVHHVRLIRRLAQGEAYPTNPHSLGVVVTLLLAVFGAAMTVYLIASTQ